MSGNGVESGLSLPCVHERLVFEASPIRLNLIYDAKVECDGFSYVTVFVRVPKCR